MVDYSKWKDIEVSYRKYDIPRIFWNGKTLLQIAIITIPHNKYKLMLAREIYSLKIVLHFLVVLVNKSF